MQITNSEVATGWSRWWDDADEVDRAAILDDTGIATLYARASWDELPRATADILLASPVPTDAPAPDDEAPAPNWLPLVAGAVLLLVFAGVLLTQATFRVPVAIALLALAALTFVDHRDPRRPHPEA